MSATIAIKREGGQTILTFENTHFVFADDFFLFLNQSLDVNNKWLLHTVSDFFLIKFFTFKIVTYDGGVHRFG